MDRVNRNRGGIEPPGRLARVPTDPPPSSTPSFVLPQNQQEYILSFHRSVGSPMHSPVEVIKGLPSQSFVISSTIIILAKRNYFYIPVPGWPTFLLVATVSQFLNHQGLERCPFFFKERRSFSFPRPMTRLFSTANSFLRMPSPRDYQQFRLLNISCKLGCACMGCKRNVGALGRCVLTMHSRVM